MDVFIYFVMLFAALGFLGTGFFVAWLSRHNDSRFEWRFSAVLVLVGSALLYVTVKNGPYVFAFH